MLNFRGTKGDKGENSRYVTSPKNVMQNAQQGDIGLTSIEYKITKLDKVIFWTSTKKAIESNSEESALLGFLIL